MNTDEVVGEIRNIGSSLWGVSTNATIQRLNDLADRIEMSNTFGDKKTPTIEPGKFCIPSEPLTIKRQSLLDFLGLDGNAEVTLNVRICPRYTLSALAPAWDKDMEGHWNNLGGFCKKPD